MRRWTCFACCCAKARRRRRKGSIPDQAKEAIFPGLHDLMVAITGDRKPLNDAFKTQLVDWYLHRVYDELDGPLSDAIARIPAS